jgi:hypothetical protein
MVKIYELLKIFSAPQYKATYARAKATGTCIRCGKPAKLFRDASAKFEYTVSALCQGCQDECLNENNHSNNPAGSPR